MLPPSSREFQGNRSCRVTYRSPIHQYQPTIGGSRLTPELTGPPHSIGIHANYRPDWSRPVGHLRNQHLKNVEEMAFVSDKLPISTSAPAEEQLFPLSTRR